MNKFPVAFHEKLLRQVPFNYRVSTNTGLQNWILYRCIINPQSLSMLEKQLPALTPRQIKLQVEVLRFKKLVTKHEYFDGESYFEAEISEGTSKTENNELLFSFDGTEATERDLIDSLSNPDAFIHSFSKRINGLLAHHVLQSYYTQLEYSTGYKEPSVEITRVELEKEIRRLQLFLDFLNQIYQESSWTNKHIRYNGSVNLDQLTVERLHKLAIEWQYHYSMNNVPIYEEEES